MVDGAGDAGPVFRVLELVKKRSAKGQAEAKRLHERLHGTEKGLALIG